MKDPEVCTIRSGFSTTSMNSYNFNMNRKTNRDKKHIFIITNCMIPLFVGLSIYLFLRDENILLFCWINDIGLLNQIVSIRKYTLAFRESMPSWFIYTLPDGIWVYSFTICLGIVWYGSRCFYYWLLIGFYMGVISELLQLFNIIRGTFCMNDMIVNFISLITAYFVLTKYMEGLYYE